jgi:hypothetical protein
MYSPAMIVAQSKINELQAEAAANRLAKKNRSARGASRGRLLGNIRSFLSLDGSTGLPKLTDYPYRS